MKKGLAPSPYSIRKHLIVVPFSHIFFLLAICTELNVGVRVEYMDRGEAEGGKVIAHDFPDGLKPKVFLLYRPGHYDILYPKSNNA